MFNNFYARRAPLIILLTIILLGSAIATNLLEISTTRKLLRKKLIEKELPLVSEKIRSEIKLSLLPPILISKRMADNPLIREWAQGISRDKGKLLDYLKTVNKKSDALTAFIVAAKDSTYYNSEGNVYHEAESDPDAAWYFEFMKSGKPLDINSTLDPDPSEIPTVIIISRITDKDNNFIGAVGLKVKLVAVTQLLKKYKDILNRNIYFVDSEGKIITSSNTAQQALKNFYSIPEIKDTLKNIFANKANFFQYTDDNDSSMLVNSNYVDELDSWLFIEHTEDQALNIVNSVLSTRFLINISSIILTLLLVILTVNHFHKQLRRLATTDRLTGISNRQIFDYTLRQSIEKYHRSRNSFSLLIVDIDHFKNVNDTLGHLSGDTVLKGVSSQIKSSIRAADDLCRWGGEEFTILAHNCELNSAAELAEKIRRNIENAPIAESDKIPPITVSIGVAAVQPEDSADSLLNRADTALYNAKESGRNCIRSCN